VNLSRIGLGSSGDMPVALKELRIVDSLNEASHAFQNKGKKSPFVIEARPWLLSRYPDSSAE
jgi:hypothetical protein